MAEGLRVVVAALRDSMSSTASRSASDEINSDVPTTKNSDWFGDHSPDDYSFNRILTTCSNCHVGLVVRALFAS